MALYFFLANTNYTDADIFAERIVKKSKFSMSTLSFSQRHTANNTNISGLFSIYGILPDGFDVKAVRIKKDGQLYFKYRIKFIKTGGDDSFCNALNVRLWNRYTEKYQGRLVDFAVDSTISSNNSDDWIIFLSLDTDDKTLVNKSCDFNIDFRSWRNQPDETSGIFSHTVLGNNVTSGVW